MNKNKGKSISLFTGAGGMDVGFSRAGFKIVWANDIDADACKTYSLNHDGEIRRGDLRKYIDEIETLTDIDLVFGGPPCQGFSVAGKMDPNDERSKLIFSFMDVVERIQPKAFVMENVKALAVLDKWKPIRTELLNKAKKIGYDFAQIVLLNATEFGVPQKRERMFFVGIKGAKKITKDLFGVSRFLKKYKKTALPIKELFHELGPAGTNRNKTQCKAKITLARQPILRRSAYAGMLFNGAGRPINAHGYSNTLPASMGGNRTPIVDEKQVFNGELSWIESYHKGLLEGKTQEDAVPPDHLRRITVEEAARIQTFPENYKFAGLQNSIYSQIGNAVPCDLAYAVASALQDILVEENL